jgi:hypothetical protein
LDENPEGPLQVYCAPEKEFDVRYRTFPTQMGLLLPAPGIGVGFTVTLTERVIDKQPGEETPSE